MKSKDVIFETGKMPTSNGDIFFKKVFTEASKKNTPLVVVHGGPCVPHNYLLPLSILAHVRPIIFYDQLGSGDSDWVEKEHGFWTLEYFTRELGELIHYLNLDQYYLLGHSWGGILILNYAFTKPKGLRGLVLASSLISMKQWTKDAHDLVEMLPEETRDIILKYEGAKQFDAEPLKKAREIWGKYFMCRVDPMPEPLATAFSKTNHKLREEIGGDKGPRFLKGKIQDVEFSDKVHKIDCPTLITCGRYDLSRPETQKKIVELMKNARLHVFENSSHMPHLEDKEEYLDVLQDFLDKL